MSFFKSDIVRGDIQEMMELQQFCFRSAMNFILLESERKIEYFEALEKLIEKAKKENAELKDEVDSLWSMMDEITKSDIENFSHILEELKVDVITKALMVTKKKADC